MYQLGIVGAGAYDGPLKMKHFRILQCDFEKQNHRGVEGAAPYM